ncbi:LolA-related protein [Acetobacter sp. LMG 32666]|uniref:LolA-related protein n=1 Tax=Acetobacter sp. LMG 32666 TaxID=2959295 RepID=UPI0030C83CDB
MKVFSLLAISGLLAGLGQAWAADSAGDLSRQIIASLGLVAQRTQPFHEKKDIAALTHPLFSSGVLAFHRPAYLEKTTQTPRQERLIIDGGMVSIQRGAGSVHHVPLAQSPALALLVTTMRAPLEGDMATLTHDYTLSAQGDLGAWTLIMTPISPQATQLVHLVVLKGRNNAIDSLKVMQANGDVQTLTLDP